MSTHGPMSGPSASMLDNAPKASKSKLVKIPGKLRLSEATKIMMQSHLELAGHDSNFFTHSAADQGTSNAWSSKTSTDMTVSLDQAFSILTTLGLHVPSYILCHVRSKFTIQQTHSRVVTGPRNGPKIPHTHITHIYQCRCGFDNTIGHGAGKKREVPWMNVGCWCWARVVITINLSNPESKHCFTCYMCIHLN